MKWLDKLEIFWFRYFSSETLGTKDYWLRYVIMGIMMIPFSFGFFFTVIGIIDLARLFTYILLLMLIPFCLVGIFVWFYHNWKLKKLNKKWNEDNTD